MIKKEPIQKIAITLRDSHIKKLNFIKSNFVRQDGKNYSFSGSIALILSYGFRAFEKNTGIKLLEVDLPIAEEIKEEETKEE